MREQIYVNLTHSSVILDECSTKTFESIKQPFSSLLQLKEIYPIFNALLKFCTTNSIFK